MSYIVRAGNLAGPVSLTVNDEGRYSGRATIIVNDRAKNAETGQWEDSATTAYNVYLHGNAATNLKAFQELNGNAAVIFTGKYRVRTYQDANGNERIAHDVFADKIGADLMRHELHIITQNGKDQG